jgi:hypothetical protein
MSQPISKKKTTMPGPKFGKETIPNTSSQSYLRFIPQSSNNLNNPQPFTQGESSKPFTQGESSNVQSPQVTTTRRYIHNDADYYAAKGKGIA